MSRELTKTFISQKDFNVALSTLLESGIYKKIENDIKHPRRWWYYGVFWTRQQIRTNIPLSMYHLLPAFMLLGLGLTPAILTFFLELLHHLCQKKITKAAKSNITTRLEAVKDDPKFVIQNI